MLTRHMKIILASVGGAITGSYIGIAALGSAISGTIPVGILFGFFAYWYTKDSKTQTSQIDDSINQTEAANIKSSIKPFEDLTETVTDAVSMLERFLTALWNLFIQLFSAIGLMPTLKKRPWILILIFFILMIVFSPIAILFLAMGVVAINENVKAENNFLITKTIIKSTINPKS